MLAFPPYRRYLPPSSDSEDGTHRFPPRETVAVPCSRGAGILSKRVGRPVAKTSPIEFIRQVQTETKKVVWPTRRETVMTGVMVVVMTTVLALFFLGVDSIFQAIVTALLKLAQ